MSIPSHIAAQLSFEINSGRAPRSEGIPRRAARTSPQQASERAERRASGWRAAERAGATRRASNGAGGGGAALRLAVLHELEEGIDNHFTVTVPGESDRYLILPFGLHWSEARASDLIVFDESGATLDGEGEVELSAQCIHTARQCGGSVATRAYMPFGLHCTAESRTWLCPSMARSCGGLGAATVSGKHKTPEAFSTSIGDRFQHPARPCGVVTQQTALHTVG